MNRPKSSNQQMVQDLLNGTVHGFMPEEKIIMTMKYHATGNETSPMPINVRTFGHTSGIVTLLALNPESEISIKGVGATTTYKLEDGARERAIERKNIEL